MSGRRSASFHRHVVASLVIAAAMALLCLPLVARADLGDDIAAAFDEFIEGLAGTEIDGVVVEGYVGGFHWEVTFIGFALCSPLDPWAEPTPVPVPPYSVYECTNMAVIDVVVAPGETTADLLITIDPLFLDLGIERDDGLCPLGPYWELPPYDPPHMSDGYILTDASFAATLQLTFDGSCVQAGIVPGTVDIALGEHTSELEIQGDGCLAFWIETFEPLLWDVLGPELETAFETLIGELMGDISDQICDLTPTERSTWGSVKSLYRSAGEGD